MKNSDHIRIQEAADILGVSSKTLRRWEASGKLIPQRSHGNQRFYSREQIDVYKSDKLSLSKKGSLGQMSVLASAKPVVHPPNHLPILKYAFGFSLLAAVIATPIYLKFQIPNSKFQTSNSSSLTSNSSPGVLAAATQTITANGFSLKVNAPAIFESIVGFLSPVNFAKDIVAPNIIYSITGGTGIGVSTGQKPTITNTGVTSIGGSTGSVSLTAGSGISVSGLTITNSDTGSAQNIFKTASVSGQLAITASSNSDIFNFAQSGGITLTTDPITKTLTISSATPNYTLSGWTKTGPVVSLTTTTDAVVMDSITFGNATITNGKSIIPNTDLGSDLGSSSYRFNNLWVANINSNSSQAFSGQTTFSYAPTDATITQASVIINPTTSSPSGQLIGLGIAGYERASIDAEGDMILGYNGLTSAPASDYPLSIYNHGATRVAYFDTSGNLNIGGAIISGTGITSSGDLTITAGYSIIPTADQVNAISIGNAASTDFVSFDTLHQRVGIGTTAPGYTLDVNGITNLSSGNSYYINGLSVLNATTLGSGVIGSSLTSTGALTGGSIASGFGNISTLNTITTTGTIGTASTTTFTGAGLTLSSQLTNSYANSAAVNLTGNGAGITFTGTGTNQITTAASQNLALMPGGYVGIGTTAPTATLDVAGNASSSGNLTFRGATANINILNGDTFNIKTSVGGDTGLAAALTILNSGYVGIGTTAPTQLLQIGTTAPFTVTSAGLVGIGTTSPSTFLHVLGTTEQLRLGYDTSNYTSFTIDSSGNLTLANNGTNVATLGQVQAAFEVPTVFDAAGDTSLAYDLIFNNQMASSIKTNAPFTIDVGQVFESNNLTLKTYNTGALVLDLAGGAALNQAQNWDLYDGTINSLSLDTNLMSFDTANARVGIGTTSPASKLDILGAAGVSPLNIASSSGTSILNIAATGLIGIGTTAPTGQLNIISTTEQLRLGYNASNYDSFTVGSTGGLTLAATGTNPNITLTPGGTGYTILNGYVGIGSTAPQGLLDVSGSSNSTDLTTFIAARSLSVINTDTTANNANGFAFRTLDLAGTLTTGAKFDAVYTSHTTNQISADLAFLTRNAGAITEKMRITSGGNVGIGTTGPGSVLSVNGGISAGSYSSTAAPANGMIISGNVGIGTTSPGYLLQVGNTGDGTQAQANAWNTLSDLRYKDNVIPLTDSLNKILALQAISFDWKSNGAVSLGFIAQDVQKVFPEVVSTDANGVLSLNYGALTAPIVEAIQEQQMQILNLQSQNSNVKSQNLDTTVFGTLEAEGAVTFKASVEFQGPAVFRAIAEYFDTVIFHKDINVLGTATFNSDTAGLAEIPAKMQQVDIVFDNEYAAPPIVTASPLWDTDQATLDMMKQLGTYVLPKQDFIVANVTAKGFTILLEQPAVTDLKFSWTATAIANVKTVVAPTPTPVPTPTPTATPETTPSATPTP